MIDQRSRAELLEAQLDAVEAYWLEIRCACGVGTFYPCRLLATRYGAQTRTRDVLVRLRCRKCQLRPASVAITDDPTGGAPGLVGERRTPWKLELAP